MKKAVKITGVVLIVAISVFVVIFSFVGYSIDGNNNITLHW